MNEKRWLEGRIGFSYRGSHRPHHLSKAIDRCRKWAYSGCNLV